MNTSNPSTLVWRKSSHSNADGGECLEVADGIPGVVPVRDSKNPNGSFLTFTNEAWQAFIEDVRAGRFPDPR